MINEDERILLENLHRDRARLTTALAGVRPRAYFEPGGAQRHLRMVCDTLWIDTDRAICTLTWRGVVPLQRPDEPGRIVIAAEERGRPLERADRSPRAREGAEGHAGPSQPPAPIHVDTLTIHSSQIAAWEARDAVLPFQRPQEPSPAEVRPPPPVSVPAPVPAPSRPAAPSPHGDVIELLWFDPEDLARIRRHPAWKKAIAEAKARPRDDESVDAEPREKQKGRGIVATPSPCSGAAIR